jgi:acetyl esterase/lipase
MKRFYRLLSYLSALLALPLLLHPRGGWGAVLLWLPKLLAAALSPWTAIAGGLGALAGARRGDLRAGLAGLLGAAAAARYAAQVSAPHAGFRRAFGPDWETRIPPELETRMRPIRYMPLPPEPPAARVRPDVVIGTHQETGEPLLADLWLPPENVPVSGVGVVYLHGSGWHYGGKDVATRPFFRYLACQGHVLADLAYTLCPQARLREMLADVRRGVAWMKAHGPGYGVDPARVVLAGGSAGGHLALLAAYTPDHPDLQAPDVQGDTSVRGVISYYGPPDLAALHDYLQSRFDLLPGGGRVERWLARHAEPLCRRIGFLPPCGRIVDANVLLPGLLGGGPDELPELYRLASPIHHAGPGCPPTLLLQGAHDLTGMAPDVRRLARALRRAGVPVVHVEFPATEHAFDLVFPSLSPPAQAALHDVERFLGLMAADGSV